MKCAPRLGLAASALAALPALSGCVAAALPAIAATGVIGMRPSVHGDEGGGSRAAEEGGQSGSAMQDSTAGKSVGADRAAHSTPGDALQGRTIEQLVAALPPPPVTPPAPSAESGGYTSFLDFAAQQGALPPAGNERRSALLATRGSLEPVTSECSIHPAAVVIDLDPGSALLDPSVAIRGDRALASGLAALRAQGVTIGWITGNSADRAGDVRQALAASGLDPAGHDELVLLRYPRERKQTRREDLAKVFCIVAIAGDERSDFDELFQYLKDPALAAPLEKLIGAGWFLIPQPLT
ncbi:hypothetical protein GCM10011515_01970 [Tsuneonella deserti]|uniref:Acid phosphatase n=1 Tax=Tsuneonella deserti TaxID=2035528 RepID=A0ABQ1S0Y8_9SPHN|nr:hypothetical protein [Tsuneonella deserti]GGD85923.1 hypothetical protein GCM10011515_01970 [Tsuneonella deserti]